MSENSEIVEQNIRDSSLTVGSGCEWQGNGSEPQWDNPKSTKAYDHINRHHGSKLKPHKLTGRAARTNDDQGQWLNDRDWVKAEQLTPKHPGEYIIDFKRVVGRVYRPDGTIVENVTRVLIKRNYDGTLKCGYPVVDSYTLPSSNRSKKNE